MRVKITTFMMSSSRRMLRSFANWWRHEHADTAAALAFYSLISLVPILITGVYIAAWLVDEETARKSLLDSTNSIAGTSVASYFSSLMGQKVQLTGSNLSPIIGVFFLLFSATKVISELRNCLSKIFGRDLKARKKRALESLINRGVSLVLLIFLGVFIACSVVMETMARLLFDVVEGYDELLWMTKMVTPLLTFVAMVLLSAISMRWLPQKPPKFIEAFRGGIVSALLLVFLKFGLALGLKNTNFGSFSGSALTLVLVLFWIYFAMQAFLFGAEYAAEIARERRVKNE